MMVGEQGKKLRGKKNILSFLVPTQLNARDSFIKYLSPKQALSMVG